MLKSSVLAAVLLLPLASTAARADVEGLPCVIDGNSLAVGSHRTNRGCQGGVVVRLFGVDAPDLAQTCRDAQNREVLCGRASASNLLEMVKGKNVVCKGNARDVQGRVVALCQIGDRDIGREMVRQGWAMALSRESTLYELDEGQAHREGVGLWQTKFEVPAEWRRRNSK
ncbi:MAG: thermonuclease family protein [Alphaproteobacteria bacterium]